MLRSDRRRGMAGMAMMAGMAVIPMMAAIATIAQTRDEDER